MKKKNPIATDNIPDPACSPAANENRSVYLYCDCCLAWLKAGEEGPRGEVLAQALSYLHRIPLEIPLFMNFCRPNEV